MLIIPPKVETRYESMWQASRVDYYYVERVKQQIDQLVKHLSYYDSNWNSFEENEYEASIEMLAYTTTEMLAQLCAGGMNWTLTDKARFLSPTVDFETTIKKHLSDDHNFQDFPRRFFKAMQLGSWDFLKVAEHTHTWFEAISFSKDEVSYLLWSAYKALNLLGFEERINGFTVLALTNDTVLDIFCKCNLPIQSVLCMQLVIDGLLPPSLQAQYDTPEDRYDFAIPERKIGVICRGEEHNEHISTNQEPYLTEQGWTIFQFPIEKILKYPASCSNEIHSLFPWTRYITFSELKVQRILELLSLTEKHDWLISEEISQEKFRELAEILKLHNRLDDLSDTIESELKKKTIQMNGHAITLEYDSNNKVALKKYNEARQATKQLEKKLVILVEYK